MQHGIIADFSHISVPSVPSYHLGLAQLEEIQDALLELRKAKEERLGKGRWRTVAWTDSFTSQGQYMFATGEIRDMSDLLESATDTTFGQLSMKSTPSPRERFHWSGWVGHVSCRFDTRADQTGWLSGTTTPFFGRLAKWLGIDVHAEARNEYKSFVQPVSRRVCLGNDHFAEDICAVYR